MRDDTLIYSTEGGRVERCRKCGQPLPRCVCRRQPTRQDEFVRVSRDRSHRHGKVVTVIAGLPGDSAQLAELAASLKRLCGSGGAVKVGLIEIQGDHREKVAARLTELGYRVKLAGG